MSDQLVLRIPDGNVEVDMACDWFHFSMAGELLAFGRDTLVTLHAQQELSITDCRITILAPASAFFLAATTIPSRQLKQVKQALPYMVEELIADDVDTVHIAIPAKLDSNTSHVDFAVISHRVLIDWLDHLHSHGFSPSKLLIDSLCIPFASNTITLLVEGENVHLRWGQYSAMIVAVAECEWALSNLLQSQQQDNPLWVKPQIKLASSSSSDIDSAMVEELTAKFQQQYADFDIKSIVYQQTLAEVLATEAAYNETGELNVLQGGYAVKSTTAISERNWLAAASIAGIGLSAYLIISLASGWYLQTQADDIDGQAVTLYKQLFPNERRVVSPKKQMENHLRLSGVQGNTQFLALLSQTAEQLNADDSSMDLQVDQLRFESSNGDLQFQVKSKSLDQLDRLKQQLAQAGLSVDINSAVEQDNFVMGRIVVRSL
ncbi:type II secretion system protein GspL [Oceanicoccus sp. KOV_DT_Chl]|uniref:type II secretion system protein GspL n=1 Tax=Oceanicoccus sp. KOV_DT_Chl TaxID=1904639 RepID=UPI000C7A252C|nr:type II secretion system protein GspL [Oceanicoccus sp. KOV_DT_Chl]